jgi:hypothetical protein
LNTYTKVFQLETLNAHSVWPTTPKFKGATIKNGILAIALEHIVPEEQKPKKIAITFAK